MNGHDFLDAAERELRTEVTKNLLDLEAEAETFLKAVRAAKAQMTASKALNALGSAETLRAKTRTLRDSLRTLAAFEEGK